jgi:mono/diheme cytochrome c family protein
LRAVSTIAFVAAFVFLGLGTLLFAMSGGRGGVGSALHSQSRGSRRFATFAFVLSLALFGFAIPAAVIRAEENNNDIPHAGVTNLTPEEERGQELFGRRCGLCHSLQAANAVARVGPDLDALAPNEQFTLDAILKGRSNGNGQMPANIYTGQDAEDVAKFVAKSVGADEATGGGGEESSGG